MHKHLTWADRLRIEKWLNAGMRPSEIADRLRVHISTVYRELKRGRYERLDGRTWEYKETYSPDIAQRRYRENLQAKGPDLKIGNDFALVEYIETKIINEGCSPAAALGYAKMEGQTFKTSVCIRTVYNYINKGVFLHLTNKDLPEKGKRRRHYRKVKAAAYAPQGASIEERPRDIDTRRDFGHWEMDTVYSAKDTSKAALLVLTERKTRKEIVLPMPDRTQRSVIRGLDRLERRFGTALFRDVFKTITVDNGSEFSDVAGLERSTRRKGPRTKIYYCHPCSSYERGTNENLNKMIRRRHPKGTDFSKVPAAAIRETEAWINNYPRAILDYQSAEILFTRCLEQLKTG